MLHSCGRTSNTLFHIFIRKESRIGRDDQVWNCWALKFLHRESSSETRSNLLILLHGIYPFQVGLHLFLRWWPKVVSITIFSWSRCQMRHPALPDWLLRRHLALICGSNSSKQRPGIFAWCGGQNLREVIQWIFTDQKKYRARKRSPESTRGAHEAGACAQGGRARPPPTWMPRVLPALLLIFLFS